MLPEDPARMLILARAHVGSEPGETPSPHTSWLDRWVDVTPRAPPIVDKSEPADHAPAAGRSVESTVAPAGVIVAFLAVLLALAVIEIIFRTTIRDWRR